MIPALAAHALHHLLSPAGKQAPGSGQSFQLPSDGSSPKTAAGSIADDLGKLSSDLLGMLGLGTPGATAKQGAQAYASSTSLGQ